MAGPYQGADGLAVDLSGGVLSLRVERPEKRNALTDEIVAALIDAVDAAGRDEAVRVILLSGAGDHFCSGFDIVARNRDATESRPRAGSIQRRLPSQAHRLIPLLLSVQTPIVCRAHGWVAGIGLHLALAADFTVVAEDARLWEPFTERGFTPDSGGSWLLPRRVGEVRAREMLLLGRPVTGAEAAEWGLVHRAVPAVLPTDYATSLPREVRGMLRSRANTIEGGTTEVNKNILGERVLGLPREPDPWAGAAWGEVPRS